MAADPLFHFFAITQTSGKDQKVVRIRTTQSLQTDLTKLFEQQAEDFIDRDAEEIAFDGGYKTMTPTLDALRSLAACADHARDAAYALDLAGIGGDVRDAAVLAERRKRRAGK